LEHTAPCTTTPRLLARVETAGRPDSLTKHLEPLAAEPARSNCPPTLGILDRAPDSFTLNGTDADDALDTLRQPPSLLRWAGNQAPAGPHRTGTVREFHGECTRPRLSAGQPRRLRGEQAAAASGWPSCGVCPEVPLQTYSGTEMR
jgi:hypothetical protein